jgi:ubiquinone/menaquinone biosynthesis C-methylase UbiE
MQKNQAVSDSELNETRDFWDRVAEDWRIQVGDDGDTNRRLNSDPVLWMFVGEVRGLKVLDAGCGTGYLSNKLIEKGALVTGIDFSERMIAIARATNSSGDFRIDSCSELRTIDDKNIDLVIANYVLMDAPDLRGTMEAFNRVLKLGGVAVLVFSHPCFPQGRASRSEDGEVIRYLWKVSYFQEHKCIDPPWAHFKSDFIWFHRPLSEYWKAFTRAGFEVIDFDEPRITEERYELAETDRSLKNNQTRPYSVAFKLRKASNSA